MIHQADMIVGIGVPGPVHFQRPRGLAALGVAQIGRDHAELALELVERVERVGREARDRGVQPATGDDQQREAGTDLLIVDANVALLIQWHSSLSLHSLVFKERLLCHCMSKATFASTMRRSVPASRCWSSPVAG